MQQADEKCGNQWNKNKDDQNNSGRKKKQVCGPLRTANPALTFFTQKVHFLSKVLQATVCQRWPALTGTFSLHSLKSYPTFSMPQPAHLPVLLNR